MKTGISIFIAAVISASAFTAQHAGAQDYFAPAAYETDYDSNYTTTANDSYVSRIEALESELASLRGSTYGGGGGCESNGGCDGKGGCDGSCDTTCVGGCDGWEGEEFCPAWEFRADYTSFRLHKEGGMQVGTGPVGADINPELVELGYLPSPRFMLRRYNKSGMFNEATYFEFNHSAPALEGGGSSIQARSYTFDWVLGERFQLNRDWDIELTGGTRWFNYRENLVDAGTGVAWNQSWGIGVILKLEMSRRIAKNWYFYGGGRFGLVQGDHSINNSRVAGGTYRLTDEHFVHTELYGGIEYTRPLANGAEFYAKLGIELISYENASAQFGPRNVAGSEGIFTPGADVGFGGNVFSLGFYR